MNSSESSFLLNWQPPKLNSEGITKYKIQLNSQPPQFTPSATTKALIKRLNPTTMYRVKISACSRQNDCGMWEEAIAWTTPRNLQEVDNPLQIESHILPKESQFFEYETPKSHTEYTVMLRACFYYENSTKFLCSLAASAQVITLPRAVKYIVFERTPSSIALQLLGPIDESHFNYTLQVTRIFNVTSLPANSEVTASLVTCCRHNLCSSSFDSATFTKPASPLNLIIANATDQTLLASWERPKDNEEPISNYRVITSDERGHEYRCDPTNLNSTRINCLVRNLSPCQHYSISVRTCARGYDCGPAITTQEYTLPEAVKELRIKQIYSTKVNFIWKPQDLESCVLANITVIVQERSTRNVSGLCFVSISDNMLNQCSTGNLIPNTEYMAFAIACSKTTLNCAAKSESIEFTTLPGVPQHFQAMIVTTESAEFRWNRSSGRQDGLDGYLVRIYETSPSGELNHKVPIANCSIPAINHIHSCNLGNLKPSTNYSATIAAFKILSNDTKTFGDESAKIYFTTNPPFPITAIILSLLALFLLLLIVFAVIFRQRSRGNAYGNDHKQDDSDISKSLTKKVGAICRERNRYVDMLPYDQSLILLGRPWPFVLDYPESSITVTDALNDYINASYVRPPKYGSKGEALPCDALEVPEFIATQGPLENTTFDFLTMVYEQRSKLIIMLCRLKENGKEKCHEYWDDECEITVTMDNRSITVNVLEVESLECDLIRRTLQIQSSDRDEASKSENIEPPIWTNIRNYEWLQISDQLEFILTSSETWASSQSFKDLWMEMVSEFDFIAAYIRVFPTILFTRTPNLPWTVVHYHFPQWPDYAAPDMGSFYNLVEWHRRFVEENPIDRDVGPPIIHCSAGVGRTGTFIAAFYLLERLREDPSAIDVWGTVLSIRRWRSNLVQVWVQLKFLYEFVLYCIERDRIHLPSASNRCKIEHAYANWFDHMGKFVKRVEIG
ncbi:unnamed protein product [Rodentolepis nana]|uniref:Uncharacterized protein n=1 Tax=Rodentolepis nana TaxID=102285 RepID=A0A3P7TRY2_RODNA|nr:unnamed protein product [Rodentolepis nana]